MQKKSQQSGKSQSSKQSKALAILIGLCTGIFLHFYYCWYRHDKSDCILFNLFKPQIHWCVKLRGQSMHSAKLFACFSIIFGCKSSKFQSKLNSACGPFCRLELVVLSILPVMHFIHCHCR
jgi:hypothetical protein